RVLREYFARPDGFKGLNIGCGPHLRPGWLNTDIFLAPGIDFAMDITRPLPFRDGSLQAIYGEEVLEHVDRKAVPPFLREAARVLRPGGALRLTTPEVRDICRIFLGLRDGVDVNWFGNGWKEGDFDPEIWINAQFRSWGHQFIWSFERLRDEMLRAGFSPVIRCEPKKSKSGIAELNELENRYGKDVPEWVYFQTMIVEAHR
ncbi:MAG: class I SAM-dependent methyltransferase, partial [Tepidisphaeraceae bacterium]